MKSKILESCDKDICRFKDFLLNYLSNREIQMKKALNEKTNDNSVFHVWTYWMNKKVMQWPRQKLALSI